MDKFDAELECIYLEIKRAFAFYSPSNLKAEITATKDAQRHIDAETQAVAQETKTTMAKLQVQDGKCKHNRYSIHNL